MHHARVTAIAAALVVIASAAIVSTARVFSGTVDEPAHIASGMQWLSTGDYTYDLQHPPLGRIAVALGPYLQGARTTGAPAVFDEGANILGAGKHYVDTLAVARHGALAFFLLAAFVTWAWARRIGGDVCAALATLMFVSNPNILAHAGLATTDMACAATTTLALFAATWWIERPAWRRSVVFGFALALAIDSRLSAIAFVGGALAVCYLARGLVGRMWRLEPNGRVGRTLGIVSVVAASCAVAIWATYRFAIGPMHEGGPRVPAPAFLEGVRMFLLHGSTGHPTFLLGTPRNHGWWYYNPVALAVKTPLPLILFSVIGIAVVIRALRERRDWLAAVPLASAATILLISMLVKVDLGVRLVLPMYPLLAIAAAQGIMELWGQARTRGARTGVAVVALSSAFIAASAYPDWLAYFNPLAGDAPDHVLVDSNLDWGQDLYRLRDTLAARGIKDSTYVAYFGTADVSAAGVPNARLLGLHEHRPGWIAASRTYLAGEWVGGAYQWLLQFPATANIGPSMILWHIPEPPPATTDSSRR